VPPQGLQGLPIAKEGGKEMIFALIFTVLFYWTIYVVYLVVGEIMMEVAEE